MELHYPGKKSVKDILDNTPACNLHGEISAENKLIKGDNLFVLQKLRELYTDKIDLIYIDPPFSTNTTFTVGDERASTVSMCNNDDVAYVDILKGSDYIEFIRERLVIARELLSDVGSIYLHIDYKIGHYIKIIMDEIFGVDNFKNDITRIKCNPKNFQRKAYGNIKDMILFYSKTKNVIWNDPKIPFNNNDKNRLFKKVDKNGRAYTTIPLHAPGETKNGVTSTEFNGIKPPKGRHWRCDPKELEELDRTGLIEWSSNGVPRKIIYADEKDGKKMQDIWEFKDYQYPDYPTEKNKDLLKTIISASSNEGSIVLDFFCGSGTTLIAAQELNRKWIGIDQSDKAIKTTKKKLHDCEYSYLETENIYRQGHHENADYLTKQIITYIGNKRSLLEFITKGIQIVQKRINKDKLDIFDVFTGSGIVARHCKQFSRFLIVNDLEKYAAITGECYLSNKDEINMPLLQDIYHDITAKISNMPLEEGIITKLYSPKNDNNIQKDERVFYTRRNAMYIDTTRNLIDAVTAQHQKYFLAPLIAEASIHANTSGVFKGFHKNKKTGIGQFGGSNSNALFRINGDIILPFPVFSNFNCEYRVYNGDSNAIIKEAPEVDLAYLDPPYNQHPYGSNYFMLNLILENKHPENISKISGIPDDWNRSAYNKKQYAYSALADLVANIKAKFVLISFNSEGFISYDEMMAMLKKIGKVQILETTYNTFRGCRNLSSLAEQGIRDIHVTEYLYLLEK